MMDREQLARLNHRVMKLRIRMLEEFAFFGILLMHLKPAFSEQIGTAGTDGSYLVIAPSFLGKLSDEEGMFLFEHEVMHCALGHCGTRQGSRQKELFNIACDIVINSMLLEYHDRKPPLVLGGAEGFCMTPDGRPGRDFTAEQVYDMLQQRWNRTGNLGDIAGTGKSIQVGVVAMDDHSGWGTANGQETAGDWASRTVDAARAADQRQAGDLPAFARRLLERKPSHQVDWRTVLQTFLQTTQEDYSYRRLHRGYLEQGILMPSLWVDQEAAEQVCFFLDASASVTEDELQAMAGEIAGALDQMQGRLHGRVRFFDVEVHPEAVELEAFVQQTKFEAPDGGGTNFHSIFQFLREHPEEEPSMVVIITDGWADYPPESESMGLPVLWLLTDESQRPPWGEWAILNG